MCRPTSELDAVWSIDMNVDVGVTSSVYVSTPGAHQVSRRRPASIQLLDQYEEIPADLATPLTSAKRRATFDDIRLKPQPPTPDVGHRQNMGQGYRQGHSQGHRSSEVGAGGDVVDTMTRKLSYDDSDVILIDSAIYG